MTYEFEYLMHLFSCGARGMSPQPPRQPVDYDRLMRLAHEQSVLPLIGAALSGASSIFFPTEKKQALLNSTRSMAFSNYLRKRQILNLLLDFQKAGIQAVLLKGFAAADMYAEPDCRISCDTDIYVERKDEKRAYELLKEHDCIVIPRSPLSHHAVCRQEKMGHIELHVSLYDAFAEDIWFGVANEKKLPQEPFEWQVFAEGACLTLGKTDNLLFLALHMIKHFIYSGISLRQMMDIALNMKTHRRQIDFKRFWDILESLKYKKMMNAVLSVLVSFCGFSPDDFWGFEPQDDTVVSALLSDLEAGGWLGKNETEGRKDAGYGYNRLRFLETRNPFSYWCYMSKRIVIRCFHAALPPRDALENSFPYAQKASCLLPIAWIHHILSGALRLLLGKPDAGIALHKRRASDKKDARMQLFRLMQMI